MAMFQMDMDFEWELSKENIRPIAQGRSVSHLSLALSKSREIECQKRKYEVELRSRVIEDLLDVWYRYIEWASQTYITGRLDFDLSEKCIKLLCKDPRYSDDRRFIQICCRYAKRCEDRFAVFNILHELGIGCKEGLFYKAWAECCEDLYKIKEANIVYEKGLKLSVTNVKELQDHYRIFLGKLATITLTKDSEDISNERKAFSVLSVSGKKKEASAIRIPSKKTPGKLVGTLKPDEKCSPNKLFAITGDFENYSSEELSILKRQYFLSANILLDKNPSKSKENVKNITKWSTYKFKQEMSHSKVPQFEIFEDDVCSNNTKPLSLISRSGILKTNHLDCGFMRLIFEEESEEIYMCPVKYMYMGSEEFSFEELMALDKRHRKMVTCKKSSLSKEYSIINEPYFANMAIHEKQLHDATKSGIHKNFGFNNGMDMYLNDGSKMKDEIQTPKEQNSGQLEDTFITSSSNNNNSKVC